MERKGKLNGGMYKFENEGISKQYRIGGLLNDF